MTYAGLMTKALDTLKNDGEIFVDMVNELDSWNGYADGFRAFPMHEIDDIFCDTKVSDFLDKLAPGFCHTDDYFIDSIYGIDSTCDIESHYRDNVDEGELLDEIIENENHLYYSDPDFEELIQAIVSGDYDEEETVVKAGESIAEGIAAALDNLTPQADTVTAIA